MTCSTMDPWWVCWCSGKFLTYSDSSWKIELRNLCYLFKDETHDKISAPTIIPWLPRCWQQGFCMTCTYIAFGCRLDKISKWDTFLLTDFHVLNQAVFICYSISRWGGLSNALYFTYLTKSALSWLYLCKWVILTLISNLKNIFITLLKRLCVLEQDWDTSGVEKMRWFGFAHVQTEGCTTEYTLAHLQEISSR